MDSLTAFIAKSIPSYENLFKVDHSDNQSLVLLENYLCYRAILDVLSFRASRWEHLVKLLYQQIKDTLNEECRQWLCLVHLAVLVRDAILHPNQCGYSDVLRCMKINSSLFGSKVLHKKLTDELNLSIACYFLSIEKDKNKVLETCDMNKEVVKLCSAFPDDFNSSQRKLMANKQPHSVLINITEQLRCVVMKMKPPVLVEMFDKCEDVQEKGKTTTSQTASNLEASDKSTELKSMDKMEISLPNVSKPTGLQSTEMESSEHQNMQCTTNNAATTTDVDGDNVAGNETSFPIVDSIDNKNAASQNIDNIDKETDSPNTAKKIYAMRERKPDANKESSSDDNISEDDEGIKQSGKSRGVRHRWTQDEVQNLVDGVKKYKAGNWSKILQNYKFLPCRDSVSLKDKWRNILKKKET